MERVFEEFNGKHPRSSDGVWFEYTATVEIIEGAPSARAKVTRVDTGEHWNISRHIPPSANADMLVLVLAAKMWVERAIDMKSGVDG